MKCRTFAERYFRWGYTAWIGMCDKRRIADYPNLSGYPLDLYQVPGVSRTVDMTHIKRHYYESHETINPTGVVPLGPEVNLEVTHARLDPDGNLPAT